MKITSKGKTKRFPKSFEVEFKNPIEVLVGSNGSGKSSLLSAIRGVFVSPSFSGGSLYDHGFKELSNQVTIEHDFDKAFFYDSVKDNPKDMNNNYDAMEFIRGGAFHTRDKSHGQSSMYMLSRMIGEVEEYRVANPTAKILVVFDEPEVGFDLSMQFKLPNIIANVVKKLNCQVIVASHNYMLVTSQEVLTVADKMEYSRLPSKFYLDRLVGKC